MRPVQALTTRWSRSTTLVVAAAAVIAAGGVATLWPHGSRAAARPQSTRSPSGYAVGVRSVPSPHVVPSTLPSAAADAGLAQVGPLFPSGLKSNHTCSASVVSSASGDTVLTAAHCLSGSVRGMLFAPGYRNGSTPYGVWTVTAAYVTARWRQDQAPADDFAVLRVANRTIDGRSRTLASVTGAEKVATTPAAGTSIRVEAYNNGNDDAAQTCTTTMTIRHGRPTFYCHGFVGGSSGSPWLLAASSTPVVVGVIGGKHQGGCTEYTSHSSVFGSAVGELVARAARGGAGDTPPSAGSDNCPTT